MPTIIRTCEYWHDRHPYSSMQLKYLEDRKMPCEAFKTKKQRYCASICQTFYKMNVNDN